ncbi:hypothetical protein AXF42_Ash012723 [Apostasia shenzhenica]|uniref:Uncharacterized protein n=1 Tax=Apostasia shenzhenica TaxID=1088818 RepID=A0A2I0AM11_9ASPA|nr:hypothetical protein AXF42_Ash012723 [Apostasia shenzhenica]
MALWMKAEGIALRLWLPEISLPQMPLPEGLLAGVGKKGRGRKGLVGAVFCSTVQRGPDAQQERKMRVELAIEDDEEDEIIGILCEFCSGSGWLLCDYCKGQKTNVKSEKSSRFYRRCPNCRAVSPSLLR